MTLVNDSAAGRTAAMRLAAVLLGAGTYASGVALPLQIPMVVQALKVWRSAPADEPLGRRASA